MAASWSASSWDSKEGCDWRNSSWGQDSKEGWNWRNSSWGQGSWGWRLSGWGQAAPPESATDFAPNKAAWGVAGADDATAARNAAIDPRVIQEDGPGGEAHPEDSLGDNPHQHEEWHQKWLRRRETRLRDVVIISDDSTKFSDADWEEEGDYGQAAVPAEEPAEEPAAAAPGSGDEREPSPHEHEVWYQKWLRRQGHREPVQQIGLHLPRRPPDENGEPGVSGTPAEVPDLYQKWLRAQRPRAVALRPRKVTYIGGSPPGEAPAPEVETGELETEEVPPEPAPPPRKSYENEEWYQKWLRRQKNKPRQVIEIGVNRHAHGAAAASNAAPADDAAAAGAHEPGSSSTAAPVSEERRAYENEEWYQKWLRRQKNKGRQIVELGVRRPQQEEEHADAGGGGLCENTEESAAALADSQPPEAQERRQYEQEEWYQKWLRRQANKDQQIIHIG